MCLKTTQNPRFIQLILHVYDINKYFYGLGGGVRQSIGYQELMTNAELMEKAGFSANIITRIKRDNYISLDSIEKICKTLNCGVDDILEFIPDKKEI